MRNKTFAKKLILFEVIRNLPTTHLYYDGIRALQEEDIKFRSSSSKNLLVRLDSYPSRVSAFRFSTFPEKSDKVLFDLSNDSDDFQMDSDVVIVIYKKLNHALKMDVFTI